MKGLVAVALAAATLTLSVGHAFSQTPIDNDPLDDRSKRRLDNMEKVMRELRSIVFQGRDSGKPVVVQPAETDAQLDALRRKVDDLEQTLRRDNAQSETLTHDLDQTRKDLAASRAQTAALDARLKAVEQSASGLVAQAQAAQAAQAAAAPVLAADPAVAFGDARKFQLAGDNAGAEKALSAFLLQLPDAPQAPEARYRLGQAFTARADNQDAAAAYVDAIRTGGKSTWTPDAMAELSRALTGLNRKPDACAMLARLAKDYPRAPPSVQAKAATVRALAQCKV